MWDRLVLASGADFRVYVCVCLFVTKAPPEPSGCV